MAKAWLRIFLNICNKLIYSRIQIQNGIPLYFFMLRIEDLPFIENIKKKQESKTSSITTLHLLI